MKLFPSVDPHVIYDEGFGETDLLNRQEAGKRLSGLLEDLDDPVVVALDGRWGSGKTHFLRRWVGAHRIENGGDATVIYFDAFANDYLEEPLIALTAAIGERLPKGSAKDNWRTAKRLAYRIALPGLRLGLAAATAGTSEVAGSIAASVVGAGAKDIESAADSFWQQKEGRTAAMNGFSACLSQLTLADEGEGRKRLIIVVDELDRCRPDYALGLLEVVKHFFNVPYVHFVLGTNLEALAHSVRARYGALVDAPEYLKRFITLTMTLPRLAGPRGRDAAAIVYYKRCAQDMDLPSDLTEGVLSHLKIEKIVDQLTLRDVEKILTRMALLPHRKRFSLASELQQCIIATILLLQTFRPDLFEAARKNHLKPSQILEFYGIEEIVSRSSEYLQAPREYYASLIGNYWIDALTPRKLFQASRWPRFFGGLRHSIYVANETVEDVISDYFGLFEIDSR